MKNVVITNGTIIPLNNKSDDVVRCHSIDGGKTLVAFKVVTKQSNSTESKARLFIDCTFFAENDDDANNMSSNIIKGTLCEIEGSETMRKGSKPDKNGNDKYFTNIVVTKFTPLSAPINSNNTTIKDDLPF